MELREIVKEIERLEDKKAEIGKDIKFIYKEAEVEGFNKKAIKKLIQAKKKNPEEVKEEDNAYLQYKEEVWE